jgi:hypothetical protein
VQKEKNLENRMHLDEPVECASGGDSLFLYKILHLMFFSLVRILCTLRLESRKIYQPCLDAGPLEFQFLRPRGCLIKLFNPFSNLSLCFGVIGKTPGLIFRNNFVFKKSASTIAIMSLQCVNLPFALVSTNVGKIRAHNFLFPKSSFRIRRTTVLVTFKDSAFILDATRRSFFLPNQQQQPYLPQFNSILDSHLSRHLLPAPFLLKIENTTQKRLIRSEPHSHKPFAPILVFLSQIDML